MGEAIENARALWRIRTWPVRSLTASRFVDSLVRQGVRPSLVIDVGANRGQFAIGMLELVPSCRVVSFEPLPEQAAALRTAGARYGDRLEVRERALGDTTGRAVLHVNAFHQSSSLLALADRHREAFPTAVPVDDVEVDLGRLDDELAVGDVPPGALLKLDVQGSELAVLRGASTVIQAFEHVLVEVSFAPMYDGEAGFEDVHGHLSRAGFRLLRPVGHLSDPSSGEYLQMDLLFARASPRGA